jgi:hypothetical protein
VAIGRDYMSVSPGRENAGGSQPTRNDATVYVGAGVSHTFYIKDKRPDGKEFEAVQLADLCIDEWRAFIAAQGLDEPEHPWAPPRQRRQSGG